MENSSHFEYKLAKNTGNHPFVFRETNNELSWMNFVTSTTKKTNNKAGTKFFLINDSKYTLQISTWTLSALLFWFFFFFWRNETFGSSQVLVFRYFYIFKSAFHFKNWIPIIHFWNSHSNQSVIVFFAVSSRIVVRVVYTFYIICLDILTTYTVTIIVTGCLYFFILKILPLNKLSSVSFSLLYLISSNFSRFTRWSTISSVKLTSLYSSAYTEIGISKLLVLHNLKITEFILKQVPFLELQFSDN